MSDHYDFICHVPQGLPRGMEESVLRVFGAGFTVGKPSDWDFQRHSFNTAASSEEFTGRMWSVTAVGRANFKVGHVGTNLVILSLTGSGLARLREQAEHEGYGLISLLKAIVRVTSASRALWLANFDSDAAISAARRQGLVANVIPHVHGTWGDEDWAKSIQAYGGVPDPHVHFHSAFRWPAFPDAPYPTEDQRERELLLTRNTLEQIVAEDKIYDLLRDFTAIEDEAAATLAKTYGAEDEWICLNGLTGLSDAAAESLAQLRGCLHLEGLSDLSDAAARSLATYQGDLFVDLELLPTSVAAILAARAG